MTSEVEIFSYIDPVYVQNRRVWYYAQFRGMKSQHRSDHSPILNWAEAIRAEHDAVLIDRSDKGSGHLRRILEAEIAR